jgi:hypothetical protein
MQEAPGAAMGSEEYEKRCYIGLKVSTTVHHAGGPGSTPGAGMGSEEYVNHGGSDCLSSLVPECLFQCRLKMPHSRKQRRQSCMTSYAWSVDH